MDKKLNNGQIPLKNALGSILKMPSILPALFSFSPYDLKSHEHFLLTDQVFFNTLVHEWAQHRSSSYEAHGNLEDTTNPFEVQPTGT